jgi:hypothetical protein
MRKVSKHSAPSTNQPKPQDSPLGQQMSVLTRKATTYLNGRAQKLSRTQKIVWISIFCLLMGAYSMSLLYRALYVSSTQTNDWKMHNLSRPVSPQLPDSLQPQSRGSWHGRSGPKLLFPDSLTNLNY